MARKPKEETLNLDTILFKCRDILRQAKNSGSFFEKRDMMLTLVFLRFIGEKYEDGVAKSRVKLIDAGLDPDDPEIQKAFFDDPTFDDGTFPLAPEARWSTIINTPSPRLNVALDTALRSIGTTNPQLKGCFIEGTFTQRNLGANDIKQVVDEVNKISHKTFGEEKDLIGRVYEYFLKEFAVNATKEEGEFYTPHDVVQLIATVIEPFDELETMVKGVYRPARFLEIFRDYIYFQDRNYDKDEVEIVCRYPQFFATRLLRESVIASVKERLSAPVHSRSVPGGHGTGRKFQGKRRITIDKYGYDTM